MASTPAVMLHVQHLLGSGHLQRVLAIARALAARGARVRVLSGGMPLPLLVSAQWRDIEFVQLPPLRAADASYREYLDRHGHAIDDAWRRQRARRVLQEFHEFAPDVLVLETFPFGRRVLRFELLPLLAAARAAVPSPRVFASIRDVLEPARKPGREQETLALLRSDFDGVLVHGDETVAPLRASFGLADDLHEQLHYTGYVVDPPPARVHGEGDDEVLVSAGGGPVGVHLLQTALAARALLRRRAASWRLLVAHSIDEVEFQRLRAGAGDGVTVERNRADFRALLGRCRVSVSQAGYNTMAEALAARAKVVAVPFAGSGEREQGLRARLFAQAGLCTLLPAECLSPAALAEAVDRAASRPAPATLPAMDGAAASAAWILSPTR